MASLDDLSTEKFNQFAGKGPSTYNDSLYTTSIDYSKLSKAEISKG